MTERTLVLVKPDGVQRQLVGRILARYEERGLKVVGLKLVHVERDLAERHYDAHRAKPFFGGLVDFITSAPLVALALEGPNAIAVVRAINGATRPHEAAPGTIRGDFALETAQNIVHASDGPEAAATELGAVVRGRRAVRLRARRRPLGARPGGVAPRLTRAGAARPSVDGADGAADGSASAGGDVAGTSGASVSAGSSGSPGTNDSWAPSIVGGRPAAASRTPNAPAETARARTASSAVPPTALATRLSDHVRASQARSSVRSSGVTTGRPVGDRRPGRPASALRQADEQQPPVVGQRPERPQEHERRERPSSAEPTMRRAGIERGEPGMPMLASTTSANTTARTGDRMAQPRRSPTRPVPKSARVAAAQAANALRATTNARIQVRAGAQASGSSAATASMTTPASPAMA